MKHEILVESILTIFLNIIRSGPYNDLSSRSALDEFIK